MGARGGVAQLRVRAQWGMPERPLPSASVLVPAGQGGIGVRIHGLVHGIAVLPPAAAARCSETEAKGAVDTAADGDGNRAQPGTAAGLGGLCLSAGLSLTTQLVQAELDRRRGAALEGQQRGGREQDGEGVAAAGAPLLKSAADAIAESPMPATGVDARALLLRSLPRDRLEGLLARLGGRLGVAGLGKDAQPPPRLFIHRSDGIGMRVDPGLVHPSRGAATRPGQGRGGLAPRWMPPPVDACVAGMMQGAAGHGPGHGLLSVLRPHPAVALHRLPRAGVSGRRHGQGHWVASVASPQVWVAAACQAATEASNRSTAGEPKSRVRTSAGPVLDPMQAAAASLTDWFAVWRPVGPSEGRTPLVVGGERGSTIKEPPGLELSHLLPSVQPVV